MRLDIAAGTAVRFEPGQSRTVRLTPYLGARESHGFQARVSGKLGPIAKVGPSNEGPTRISRAAYAGMFARAPIACALGDGRVHPLPYASLIGD